MQATTCMALLFTIKTKINMAKTALIPKLKEGHTIIGQVVEKENEAIVLKDFNGNTMRVPLHYTIVQALEICESETPILEITMQNGTYHIYEHDVWPNEKSKD